MRNLPKTFTKDEINNLVVDCNFTPKEKRLFELRSMDLTIVECAEIMCLSEKTVSRINKGLNNKLTKLAR